MVDGFYLAFSVLAASLVLLFYKFCAALGQNTLIGVGEGIAFGIVLFILPPLCCGSSPGIRLKAKNQPEFLEWLTQIARASGREMPARVILTYATEVRILRDGGRLGIGKRWTIAIGLPLMQVLTVPELETIIRRDFAQFPTRTAGYFRWISRASSGIKSTMDLLAVEEFRREGSKLGKAMQRRGQAFLRAAVRIEGIRKRKADRAALSGAESGAFLAAERTIEVSRRPAEEFIVYDILPILSAGYIPPFVEGLTEILSRPGATPKRTTALSMLKDFPSLERRLIADAFYIRTKKLKPIPWADVGRSVWLPQWNDDVRKSWLASESLGDVFDHSTNRLSHTKRHTLGAALACILYRDGWYLDSGPGIRTFKKGDAEINPFETVTQINQGSIKLLDWIYRMRSLKLNPTTPLYPPSSK